MDKLEKELIKIKIDSVNINGEGINEATPVSYSNQNYGTQIKTLLPHIDSTTTYKEGYTYKGWQVLGDVDNNGNIKEDYVVDLNNSNLTLKNDLIITLIAEKIKCSVKFIYTNPEGVTVNTIIKELSYGDLLSDLYDYVNQELNVNHNYFGYNFKEWQINQNDILSYSSDLSGIIVKSPINIKTIYEVADVNIKYVYDPINDIDNINYTTLAKYNDLLVINTSELPTYPTKDKYILKGWTDDLLNILKIMTHSKLMKRALN